MRKIEKKRLIQLVLILTICAVAVFGCLRIFAGKCGIENHSDGIREKMKKLDEVQSDSYPQEVLSYFEYYGLNVNSDELEHIFGSFESNDQALAAHIFIPKDYKATVIVMHGFFNHCGQLNHLIKYLTEQGYAVAAYDMPGHGLSTGERAWIDDFSQYSDALRDFMNVLTKKLKGPYHLVGHSTGASAALDYLLTCKDSAFDKVVLVAPLVRCSAWGPSKTGFKLYSPFAETIPRVFRNNSSDEKFLQFVRTKDPLQLRCVNLKWVKALHQWNDKISDLEKCDSEVKILQGTNDKTVDWEFNIKFIKNKFSSVEVSLIENAHHELFNESANIRKEVFSQILAWLEN